MDEGKPLATDVTSVKENATMAVDAFMERWIPMPSFTERCEVMDQARLRDAMGLHASIDIGDPWPAVENDLLRKGFRWHQLGCCRVMYLQERDGYEPDDGWQDAEEAEE